MDGHSITVGYDVFLSHAWIDGPDLDTSRVKALHDTLKGVGLRPFLDAQQIGEFESIPSRVRDALPTSKVFLAFYSKTYPTRRACQWELTEAYLAARRLGNPADRVLVISFDEELGVGHIYPTQLREQRLAVAPATDDVEGLAGLVERIRQIVERTSGPLGTAATDQTAYYGYLPFRASTFLGRIPDLWSVHSHLQDSVAAQIIGTDGQTVALVSGIAGVGKSLLAREYALQFAAAYPGGVTWLRASGRSEEPDGPPVDRATQLRKVARDMGYDTADMAPDNIVNLIRGHIADNDASLWVVDDLPTDLTTAQVHGWCAPHQNAKTLITTRTTRYRNLGAQIELRGLPETDGFRLVTSRRDAGGEQEAEAARGLVQDLDGHPLALALVAAALELRRGRQTFAQYRTALAAPTTDQLALAADLADELPTGYDRNIAATLGQSVDDLGPEGRDFLTLASQLSHAPIPDVLIERIFDEALDLLDPDSLTATVDRAFHQADGLALSEAVGEAHVVHPLVSRTIQRIADPDRREAFRLAAARGLTSQLRDSYAEESTRALPLDALGHARELLRRAKRDQIDVTLEWLDLESVIARYEHLHGNYGSARALRREVVDTRSALLGPAHPDTLQAASDLARSAFMEGDREYAFEVETKVLEQRAESLGDEHPDTLDSVRDYVRSLIVRGEFDRAVALADYLLQTRKRILGDDHPDTLDSMSLLSQAMKTVHWMSSLYNPSLTRRLEEEALAGRRRVLGSEHPDTLASMNNLGAILLQNRDYAGAQALLEEVVDANRRLHGDEHPLTLATINNLHLAVGGAGDVERATQLQLESLEGRRKVLGDRHPSTIQSLHRRARILEMAGDNAAAQELREQFALPEKPEVVDHGRNLVAQMNALSESMLAGHEEETDEPDEDDLDVEETEDDPRGGWRSLFRRRG